MVTFYRLGRLGRLGNQLFQYAALKSIALETGRVPKIPFLDGVEWHGQECQLKHFSLECQYLTDTDLKNIEHQYHAPDHTKFFSDVFTIPNNTDIVGYFQNYQYFSKYAPQIRREFTLDASIQQAASHYINGIRSKGNSKSKIVSVHMRRGDNTDGQNPDMVNFYGTGDVLTSSSEVGQYFYQALHTFKDMDIKFLVFSGGSRKVGNQTDIEWCKTNFFGDNVYYSEGNSDILDFEIMRQCDHNIACHMTSFGWWAAFLNDNPDKIVVAPRNYTIPDDHRQDHGFYPPNWRLI